MTKKEASRLGGRATVQKHGSEHMAEIGRKGAEATWTKYVLVPFDTSRFAMVDRQTKEIVAFI